MPIYEYRRPDGSTFEVMQSFSEESLRKDPETGVKVERVFHAPAVHFKGKGFYNTDYGTRKRQKETAAAGEGSSNGAGKDGASSDGSSASESKVSSSEGKSESKTGADKASKDTGPSKKSDSKPVSAAK
jgi:putative FmdB family regulatory protein